MSSNNELNTVYGERIRMYREFSRLSQAQAADILGMNRSTYARREKKGDFSCDMIFTLAKAFRSSSDLILYGEERSFPPVQQIQNKIDNREIPVRLNSPAPPFNTNDDFILTNDEKNKIKIFRRLSEEDKKFLNKFLEERQ